MKEATAEAIVKAAESLGIEDEVSLYQNYSGRGMFGARTTGVVVSSLGVLFACLAQAGADAYERKQHEGVRDAVYDLTADAQLLRWDNMAMDIIVY